MQNELYKKISALPAKDVYYLGPPKNIIQGFDYYKKGHTTRLLWDKDKTKLFAHVNGVTVALSLNNGDIKFKCDCQTWTFDENCLHVICAMLTVKNIISPQLFTVENRDSSNQKTLKAMLEDKHSGKLSVNAKTGTVILIEPNPNGHLKISALRGGKKLYQFSSGLSNELRQLLLSSVYPWMAEEALISFLSRGNEGFPVILNTNKGQLNLRWAGPLSVIGKIELNLKSGMVIAQRMCIENKQNNNNFLLLGDKLVADCANKKLGTVKESMAWGIWGILRKINKGERPGLLGAKQADLHAGNFKISNSVFNGIQLSYAANNRQSYLNDIVFKSDNKPVTPRTEKLRHRIKIQGTEDEKYMLLKLESIYYDEEFPPTNAFFKYLSIEGASEHQLFRTKKKRRTLIETFLSLLSLENEKDVKRIIDEKVKVGNLFNNKKAESEAKKFLDGCYKFYQNPLERIGCHKNKWNIIPLDIRKEAFLYIIPFTLFGWEIFDKMERHDEMFVLAENLYKILPELMDSLTKNGIELLYDDKPVITSKWDFCFEASGGASIDWFEIMPEISCDGKLISKREWSKVLKGIGVLEEKNAVRIMDAESRNILATLSGMLGGGNGALRQDTSSEKGNRPRNKEIINVSRMQILDWICLRKKGVKVRLPEEDERLVERLTNFSELGQRTIPEGLNAELREYQKDGYSWLAFLYEHRFGACLADDMGLGKTIQAITLLGGIREGQVSPPGKWEGGPHLAVLPPSLIFNWRHEVERFYPALKIKEYIGQNRVFDFSGVDLVLTTYDIILRDIDKFKEIYFNVILFDEAQAIKNIFAKRTASVRQLRGYFKLAMTGTPLQNHVGEYYSILDLCLPGLLDGYEAFKAHSKKSDQNIERLLQRTKPFVLRRTKERILNELPKKTESNIYLELSERQKDLYKKIVEQVKTTIDTAYREKTGAKARIIALTAILRLRQICVSPRLVDPTCTEPSPKVRYLVETLMELMDEGHSALVFSQFTTFLDVLGEELEKEEIDYVRMDGTTPVNKRKDLVKNYQDGNGPPIFLMSLKTGGVGLNLVRASYVFHLDPWWNPAVEDQASDRAYRIGQKNKVLVTRILTHHTIEEKMMALKKKKLELYRTIMDGGVERKKGKVLDKSDFDFLLN